MKGGTKDQYSERSIIIWDLGEVRGICGENERRGRRRTREDHVKVDNDLRRSAVLGQRNEVDEEGDVAALRRRPLLKQRLDKVQGRLVGLGLPKRRWIPHEELVDELQRLTQIQDL